MRYEIRALGADNDITTIAVDALDESGARKQVADRALRILSVRGLRTGGRKGAFSLLLFSQELLALLDAGLSIVEALDALAERRAGAQINVVAQQLAEALRQGQRLSQALASLPSHFPPVYIGVVQAAETTSALSGALSRYVEFEQRLGALRSRAVSAAIYPAILLTVGGAVTLFLLGYVVPRFASVYEDAGRSMSTITRLLLGWGQFVSANFQLLLIVLLAMLIGAVLAWRALRGRYGFADLFSRLPVIGIHILHFELSRLYMTLGLLLTGGIPLSRALQLVVPTVGFTTAQRLGRTATLIAAGQPFSAAMEREQLAASVALRLFRVGERTGNLGEMLLRSANYYDGEITRFVDRFTRMAEPLLMTAIGLIVGTIVVLLYMPIFELAGSLQ